MNAETIRARLGVDERTARSIMRAADHDGDGYVTYQEMNDHLWLHTEYPAGNIATSPTSVYIAKAAAGCCLYVGITGSGVQRLHSHRKAARWWTLAATVELEHYPNREHAEARERQLIRELRPEFNVMYAERVA